MAKGWFDQSIDAGRSILNGGVSFVSKSVNTVGKALRESQADGHLIGPNDKIYPVGTELSEVEYFKPQTGQDRDYTVVLVNGIINDPDQLRDNCQKVADSLHVHVVGLYNLTEGLDKDLEESVEEKAGRHGNPAVTQIAVLIEEAVLTGHRLHMMGHSEGALLISHAVREIKDYLKEEMPEKVIEKAMHDNVWVDTFGGVAATYATGPSYVHHINENDFVAHYLGVNDRTLGPGETLHTFKAELGDNHGMLGYLDHMPNRAPHDSDHWNGIPAFMETQTHVSPDGDGGRTNHADVWGGAWSHHSGQTEDQISGGSHGHGDQTPVTDRSGSDPDYSRRADDPRTDHHQSHLDETHHHSQDGHDGPGIHHSDD